MLLSCPQLTFNFVEWRDIYRGIYFVFLWLFLSCLSKLSLDTVETLCIELTRGQVCTCGEAYRTQKVPIGQVGHPHVR